MKERLLQQWNFVRVLRLILGLIITISSIQTTDYIFIVLGAILSLMAIFNIGSCSNGSCNIN
ncbi:MAG: hypothetical protein H6553_00740 [Chitinophagales bacterium]|nr:hypothetical protein [Chitinophagales bacterium]